MNLQSFCSQFYSNWLNSNILQRKTKRNENETKFIDVAQYLATKRNTKRIIFVFFSSPFRLSRKYRLFSFRFKRNHNPVGHDRDQRTRNFLVMNGRFLKTMLFDGLALSRAPRLSLCVSSSGSSTARSAWRSRAGGGCAAE